MTSAMPYLRRLRDGLDLLRQECTGLPQPFARFIRDSKEPRVGHPTQKALEVMKWCIASFSKPGDTVLDPFLGSGTTAVAAKLLGRNFIASNRTRNMSL